MNLRYSPLLALALLLSGCGEEPLEPEQRALLNNNKPNYQNFMAELARIGRGVALAKLAAFAADEADQNANFLSYAERIDSSPLLGDEYDYIEGILIKSGEQIVGATVLSVIRDRGLSIFDGAASALVNVIREDADAGVYEYAIEQTGMQLNNCDSTLVACLVDMDLHVRIGFPSDPPTLTSIPGQFSYRLTLSDINIELVSLTVTNERVSMVVPAGTVAAHVDSIEFDFDLLAFSSSYSMTIHNAIAAADFTLAENNVVDPVVFTGQFNAEVANMDIDFALINDSKLLIPQVSGLAVQVSGDTSGAIVSHIEYGFAGDESAIPAGQPYAYLMGVAAPGVANEEQELNLDWHLQFALRDANTASELFSLTGSGKKQTDDLYQIEDMQIAGQFISDHYGLSAEIKDEMLTNYNIAAEFVFGMQGGDGILIDPLVGLVAEIIVTRDNLFNTLFIGDQSQGQY